MGAQQVDRNLAVNRVLVDHKNLRQGKLKYNSVVYSSDHIL